MSFCSVNAQNFLAITKYGCTGHNIWNLEWRDIFSMKYCTRFTSSSLRGYFHYHYIYPWNISNYNSDSNPWSMENDSESEYKLTSENLFNKWIDFFIHDWLTSENKAALKINHKIKMISKSDQISKKFTRSRSHLSLGFISHRKKHS